MWVPACIYVFMCTTLHAWCLWRPKRVWIQWNRSYSGCNLWVLGTEPWTSARAASALDRWANSPALWFCWFACFCSIGVGIQASRHTSKLYLSPCILLFLSLRQGLACNLLPSQWWLWPSWLGSQVLGLQCVPPGLTFGHCGNLPSISSCLWRSENSFQGLDTWWTSD